MTDTTPDTGPRHWLGTVRYAGTVTAGVLLWGPEDDGDYLGMMPGESWFWVPAEDASDLIPAVVQPEATPDTDDEVERLAEIAYETQRQAWLPTLRINRWAEQSDSLRESWRKGIRAVLAARRSAGEA